jgi:hypothetical protein
MFTTYENHNNKHITIHKTGCSQIRKNGGNNIPGRDEYNNFQTYDEAYTYAESTKLPLRNCSMCKPR